MSFGLRLLLLVVALLAVVIGYTRYQLIYLHANYVSLANGPTTKSHELTEPSGAVSRLYSNGNGDIVRAHFRGANGIKRVVNDGTAESIVELLIDSQVAFDALDPSEFPAVTILTLSKLNWDFVDFEKLRSFEALIKLDIFANRVPPELVLNKLPTDIAVRELEVSGYLHSRNGFENARLPGSVNRLIINSHGIAPEQIEPLQRRYPECRVIGYDIASQRTVFGE